MYSNSILTNSSHQPYQELPLVSVVTVCRNSRMALLSTMRSVETQTYPNLEYIIVDGASEDGTVNVLNTYEGRLSAWVSEPDKGIYDAMNKAVGIATGQWVIFMNAGDVFASTNVLSDIFAELRDCDVIYGDVIKNGTVKQAEIPHNSHRMYYCHQSALTLRDCLLRFPFDCRHTMSADYKQMKQMYLAGCRFIQLHFPIAKYDMGGVSNRQRSSGLRDNISVVLEIDSWKDQLKFLPSLVFVYLLCKLRGK